jgi:hypothetical protein
MPLQIGSLVSNWEIPVSALVNALRERIAKKATLTSAQSSEPRTSLRAVFPAPALASTRLGAPERSDWARRLMVLGELTKLENAVEYENSSNVGSNAVDTWSASSYSNAKP